MTSNLSTASEGHRTKRFAIRLKCYESCNATGASHDGIVGGDSVGDCAFAGSVAVGNASHRKETLAREFVN